MMKDKLFALVALMLAALVFLFVITEAFHLISAPSDISVVLGVLLFCVALFAIIKLTIFAFKKLF